LRTKERSLFLLCFLTITLLIPTVAIGVPAASVPTVVIDLSHGQGPSDGDWTGHKLEALMASFEADLVAKGLHVVWATQINEAILGDAQFLFLGSVYGATFTDAEIAAIGAWFSQGEKTIWVGGDSDYGASTIPFEMNRVLRAIGSKLRLEHASLEDPITNCGAGYRPRANVTNTMDAEVAGIVAGINTTKGVLFHGPTVLYAVDKGMAVPLETMMVDNVYWVMKSGASGIIVDADPTVNPPLAHEIGAQGSFVTMAVEKYVCGHGNCKVIVSGENPYGGYQPMYSSEYYDIALDGPTLVMQAVDWGLNIESAADQMMSDVNDAISQAEAALTATIDAQASTISALQAEVEGIRTLVYVAIVIGLVGIGVGAFGMLGKKS
jgi:hypothetical protein